MVSKVDSWPPCRLLLPVKTPAAIKEKLYQEISKALAHPNVAGKLKDALEELEKTMIREGLRRTNWNKSRLAKELGISRAGLIMKVEKYGLDKRRLPRPGSGEAA